MGLSHYIETVIERNYPKMITDIPLQQFLIDLRARQVLSNEEVDELNSFRTNKEMIYNFIKILKFRADQDFFHLCDTLQEHGAITVQEFGEALQNEAELRRRAEDENEKGKPTNSAYLLRDLPPTPESHYIVRQTFVDKICSHLKDIDNSQGHLLIHGMAGCGKTIAVCQSVRMVFEQGYFQSHGVYWAKLGDIGKDKLFTILKSLCIKIGVTWKEPPQNLEEIDAYAKQYFEENQDKNNILFIFDDIWQKSHYNYLRFATKSIATSRFFHPENKLHYKCISASDRFTYEEAIKVLAKNRNIQDLQSLYNNRNIALAIESCGGLPLAIALIGGLHLQTDKQWESVIKVIEKKEIGDLPANYDFNLFGTFSLSIKELEGKKKQCFLLLGVFKKVKIPIGSIMSLWKQNECSTISLLQEFRNKSLLRFIETNGYCILHDLMVDYLQQSHDPQLSNKVYWENMNQTLVQHYFYHCQGQWGTYPNDGYFYQNLVYHAIQAHADVLLRTLMADFNWMTSKFKIFKTLFNLQLDLEDYIKYLDKQKENSLQYQELLTSLRQYESYADMETMDFIQFLLNTNESKSWIISRALQLACENTIRGISRYWMITTYPQNKVKYSAWMASKTLCTTLNEVVPRCSSLKYGKLNIIYNDLNKTHECCITIVDYETSKTIFNLPLPNKLIAKIRISPDGKIIAYSMKKDEDTFVMNWVVYSIATGQQLNFTSKDGSKSPTIEGSFLEFCPVLAEDRYILMTVSNRKNVNIWMVTGDSICQICKTITSSESINTCQFIESSCKILVWYGKYYDNRRSKGEERMWVNECLVDIRDAENLQFQSSYIMPIYIQQRDGKYLPSSDLKLKYGFGLACIKLIDKNGIAIVAAYQHILGYIALHNITNGRHDFVKEFARSFQPIYLCDKSINDIVTSDDHQFIAVHTQGEQLKVFKLASRNFSAFTSIDCIQYYRDLMFIPDSYHLFIYDPIPPSRLYRYDLQAKDLSWQPISSATLIQDQQKLNYNEELIAYSNHAFINNIPHAVQLVINKRYKNSNLRIYRGENFKLISEYKLKQNYKQCILHDDMEAVILVQIYECDCNDCIKDCPTDHWHIIFSKLLYGIFYAMKRMQEIKYILPEKPHNIWIVKSRFRKFDKSLIFILQARYLNDCQQIIIMKINYHTCDLKVYRDTESEFYRDLNILHFDDGNLVTHQISLNNSQSIIKHYKIGQALTGIQLMKPYQYDKNDGIACKISLPINEMTSDLNIVTSAWKKDSMIDTFGQSDTDSFINYCQGNKECYLLVKEEDITMFTLNGRILMKGYRDATAVFKADINYIENLWPYQFLVVIEKLTCKIYFYNKLTLKLVQVIQSPYIKIWRLNGNSDQSLFICQSFDKEYGIIKPVTNAMIK